MADDGSSPVSGAVIQLRGVEGVGEPLCAAISGSDGSFTLALDTTPASAGSEIVHRPFGLLRLVAESQAGALRSAPCVFEAQSIDRQGEVTLRLEPAIRLVGRVVRSARSPVAHATVRIDEVFNKSTIEPSQIAAIHTFRQSVQAGADGRFEAWVLPSLVRAWARAGDGAWSPAVKAAAATDAGTCDVGDITLPARSGVLWLRAVDEDGRAVPGATAMLESDEAVACEPQAGYRERPWHLMFAADGTATLPIDRDAGTLVIAMTAPGRRAVTLCVDRRAVTEAGVEVVLPRRPAIVIHFDSPADSRARECLLRATASAFRRDGGSAPVSLFAAHPPGTPTVEKTRGDISPAQNAMLPVGTTPFTDGGQPALHVEVESPGVYTVSVSVPFVGAWHGEFEATADAAHRNPAVVVPDLHPVVFTLLGDGAQRTAPAGDPELMIMAGDDPEGLPPADPKLRRRPRALKTNVWRPEPSRLRPEPDGRYRGFVPVGTRSIAYRWRAGRSEWTIVEIPASGELEIRR